MKKIIIESIDMIRCIMNNEYVSLSNCCYCRLNKLENDVDDYIYCKYKK